MSTSLSLRLRSFQFFLLFESESVPTWRLSCECVYLCISATVSSIKEFYPRVFNRAYHCVCHVTDSYCATEMEYYCNSVIHPFVSYLNLRVNYVYVFLCAYAHVSMVCIYTHDKARGHCQMSSSITIYLNS